ncbi:FadR/GntR family transcriptional regulator [Pseudarthrobacter sp. S9]|uniref:FadR/GntR family transcriptional regulator n=1 Tax=Pseudarthrobacter sp. S9 TaxID=3418421 RepID=UPI003D03BA94
MRTHQLVLQWIEKQLIDGQLTVGGRLPAERTLAEQLEVSRTSVREAIRILEAMGVVRAGVGSGPDAGTVVIADPLRVRLERYQGLIASPFNRVGREPGIQSSCPVQF